MTTANEENSVEQADIDTPAGPYAATATRYLNAGWSPLPLPAGQKTPVPKGYTGANGETPSYPDVHAWTEDKGDGNVALRLPPDVIGVDVDHYADKPGGLVLQQLEQQLGELPTTWRTTSRDDGHSGIRLYRVPAGLRWPGGLGPGIDTIRHDHRYAVAWPSTHPNGSTYRWITPDGATALSDIPTPDDLPDLPAAWVEHFTKGEMSTGQASADLSATAANTWLTERGQGTPCRHMSAASSRAAADLGAASSRHDATLAATNRVIWLAGQGHTGAGAALAQLHTAFTRAVAPERGDQAAQAEWERMIHGAVDIAAAAHPTPQPDPCLDPFAGLIPKESQWTPSESSTASQPQKTSPSTSPASPTPSNNSFSSPIGSPSTSESSAPTVSTGSTPEQATSPGSPTPATDGLDPEKLQVYYLEELARITGRQAAQKHYEDTHRDQVVADRVRRKMLDDEAKLEHRRLTEPPAPPFDAGTLADILARPDDPPMRAQGLIPWEASTLIVAARKTGKTTTMLNYARSLLTGEDFLDEFPVIPIEQHQRVAVLNYEVSAKMLARWAADIGIDPDRLYLVNLRGRRNPLGRDDDRAELAAHLRAIDTAVVMVDPFGRAFTGDSQNDNAEVQHFLIDLDTFARNDVGASDLVLAAHAGWDGERSRGASALEDWPDTIINLSGDGEGDDRRRFMRAMGRDVEVDEDELVMDPLTRVLSRAGTGGRRGGKGPSLAKVAHLADAIVQVVSEQPGCGKNAIVDALADLPGLPATGKKGRGFETLTTAIKQAERDGRLTCEAGGKGQANAYFVTSYPQVLPTTPNYSPEVGTTYSPTLREGSSSSSSSRGSTENVDGSSSGLGRWVPIAGGTQEVNTHTKEVRNR